VHVDLDGSDEDLAVVEPALSTFCIQGNAFKFSKLVDSSISDDPEAEALDYIIALVEPLCQTTFIQQ
jgi:hypothetical protein